MNALHAEILLSLPASRKELTAKLGADDRAIRQAISDLTREGYFIVSEGGKYTRTPTQKGKDDYLRKTIAQGKAILKRIQVLTGLDAKQAQQTLFE